MLPYIGCPSAFTPAPEVASCDAPAADEEARPPYPPPETCPRVAWLAHCGACIPNPDTACCVCCTALGVCKLPYPDPVKFCGTEYPVPAVGEIP